MKECKDELGKEQEAPAADQRYPSPKEIHDGWFQTKNPPDSRQNQEVHPTPEGNSRYPVEDREQEILGGRHEHLKRAYQIIEKHQATEKNTYDRKVPVHTKQNSIHTVVLYTDLPLQRSHFSD
jgi:hypothetical protein